MLIAALCLAAGLLGGASRVEAAMALSDEVRTENVVAYLMAEHAPVVPGQSVELALVLDIRPGWHTYWRNPGDSGEPPRIAWDLPAGVEAGPIRWPAPELIRVGPLANHGYSERAIHLVELRIPKAWPAGQPVSIRADATWLVCDEACIPEQGRFALSLDTVAALPSTAQSAPPELFADARRALPAPAGLTATLDREDGLRLRVPAAALPEGITGVHFFAGAWGLVEHAAEQRWQVRDGALVLRMVPGATPEAVPAAGLLVVETPAGRASFEVDARSPPSSSASSAGQATVVTAGTETATADRASRAGEGIIGPDLGPALALLFALLGGLALNLMPCVFPVLAIKALGLARQAGAPVRERARHALAYGAGVLLFFALTALLLLALRASGAAVGWGFQLQSPVFVAFMAYLFLVLGLSLAGAVTIGTALMGVGASDRLGNVRQGSSRVSRGRPEIGPGAGPRSGTGDALGQRPLGAFVTGALAALVAAPCTAPFMGAALGYAATLPWLPALCIMLTLGVGMALPFMLLALVPRLGARLPRPGPWMEHLKQLLAFPMFATAAWLVWVLSVQTGSGGVGAVLTGMLALSLALWLLERTHNGRPRWRWLGLGGALPGLAVAVWLGATMARFDAPARPMGLDGTGVVVSAADGASDGVPDVLRIQPYSAEALATARASGRPVFVNMTAAWCITCLVNERVALSSDTIARAFAERDLLYLKGDWTNRDPRITDYLAEFGRNGVPIYVFYPAHGEPRVLPQILTESKVLSALR